MPTEGDQMVRVKETTWKRLNVRKDPGQSFDDVISDLLDAAEELEESEE